MILCDALICLLGGGVDKYILSWKRKLNHFSVVYPSTSFPAVLHPVLHLTQISFKSYFLMNEISMFSTSNHSICTK